METNNPETNIESSIIYDLSSLPDQTPLKIPSSLIPWSKLNKMTKINKLNLFCERYKDENTLNDEETNELKRYLRECLNRKKLQNTKEVIYDKDSGMITSIPNLTISDIQKSKDKMRKFTLKSTSKQSMKLSNQIILRSKTMKNTLKKNNE